MSGPTPPTDDTRGQLIRAGLVLGVTVLVCITVVAVAVPHVERAMVIIGQLVVALTALLGFLGLFLKLQQLSAGVDQVASTTEDLANGLGSAKTRDALATVLPDALIDPEAKPLLAQDRARLQHRAADQALTAQERALRRVLSDQDQPDL